MDKKNTGTLFWWITIFSPLYFLLFSFLRCYLEAAVLAREYFFSYYTLLHHTLWNFTTILAIILVLNLFLKLPPSRLLWLMYGVTLMATPLIYSFITGEKLHLDYLRGNFFEILKHTFTFCLTYQRNNPLTVELIIIFIGIFCTGYFYTGRWWKALILAVIVHITGNFIAIYWFGVGPDTGAVIPVTTRLNNHPFLAVIYLHTTSFLTFVLIWREGLFFDNKNYWLISLLFAFAGWMIYIIISFSTGFFKEYFDIIATALPAGTFIFILVRFFLPHNRSIPWYTWILIFSLFFMQLAVMIPVYLYKPGVVFL